MHLHWRYHSFALSQQNDVSLTRFLGMMFRLGRCMSWGSKFFLVSLTSSCSSSLLSHADPVTLTSAAVVGLSFFCFVASPLTVLLLPPFFTAASSFARSSSCDGVTLSLPSLSFILRMSGSRTRGAAGGNVSMLFASSCLSKVWWPWLARRRVMTGQLMGVRGMGQDWGRGWGWGWWPDSEGTLLWLRT